MLGRIVIERGDDIGPAILLKADVGNLTLFEEFLGALRDSALGMPTATNDVV